MALRVKEGWQVKHNGKMHHGGDTLENVRDADAARWLGGGYVEEFDDKKSGSKEPEAKPSASPGAKKTTTRGDA